MLKTIANQYLQKQNISPQDVEIVSGHCQGADRLGEGIHARAKEIEWFAWDEEKGGFYETEKSEWSFGCCNHALG